MTGTERAPSGGGSALAWVADPVRFQLLFTVLYGVDVGIRLAFGFRFDLASGPGIGVLLAVALLVVTPLVPWQRLDPSVAVLLPLADIAVIGVTRLVPEGGNSLLIVFPALWLGHRWGRSGALVTLVATVALVAVPGALYAGLDPVLLSRGLFIPVVAVVTAMVVALGLEHVRAQTSELEHQRRVSEAIFDTVDVGLLLLDRDGRYIGMNRRHQQFMELAFPEGHAGRAGELGDAFDVDGRTRLTRTQMPTDRATRGEEFDDLRIWVGGDAAARRALSVSARAFRSGDGAFAGAALSYTDVTDFMRALRVKDEFVALVSHELRTPLTSILGYVQILGEDESLPAQATDKLAVVLRNAERLRRLIGDLLDTAQRDGSPMPISRSRADLAQIVVEAATAARPHADAVGVGLELDVPDTLPMSLDAQRIAQVVDNLVSNAIKYTESGGCVTVRLSASAGAVDLAVADTGIGISAEDRERLFTRFFRTEDAARRAVAGAGLGLSITKDIVESHGGRIEVESEVGRGSVFRVRLPR